MQIEPAKLPHPQEYPMQIRIMLVAGLMLVPTWGAAQTADAPPQLTLDQARAQRSKARDIKAEARKTHDAEIKACQRQAIAIRCISSAKEKREETLKRAEALELEGRTVEREALRREAEAKAAKREAEAAKRQAREPADVERYRKTRPNGPPSASGGRPGNPPGWKAVATGSRRKRRHARKSSRSRNKRRQASRRGGRPGPREGTEAGTAGEARGENRRAQAQARRTGETARGEAGGGRVGRVGRHSATRRATVKSRRRRHGALPAPARPI
ncbi:MAG: hypothetical protein IPH41_18350 [Sulfuritalea sp.]|nr:hypothetical protein [Sulfuritalea sp.]